MSIDLSRLSQAELEAVIAQAKKQKVTLHRQQTGDTRKKVADYAKSLGYSLDELFGGRGKGKARGKAAPKYRNPANPEQTWSGRGKRPNWFKQSLAAGRSEASLRV